MLFGVVLAAALKYELSSLLQIASNSANMAPLELKMAELKSHDSQLFNSATFNPNGTILVEIRVIQVGAQSCRFILHHTPGYHTPWPGSVEL